MHAGDDYKWCVSRVSTDRHASSWMLYTRSLYLALNLRTWDGVSLLVLA